ncbi:MAG: urease accessory protein UreD [Mycolicibacterium hassiacum]|uniref:urease accessory protein UreD n=1 Tax=Mycolicibacterium hassiacum TaxID=46351 RepID=UPI0023F8CBB9|nr:urease accessory protein UreD [Mycolicibacterium hassiacum]MBX5488030.1 urease accessory protein UreD [Mycolicibacterium hassiacum]
MTRAAVLPGELTVEVVADAAGRTRTATLRQSYPQRVTAPMYCDPDYPGAALLCVQSPSGGAFPDDDLRTAVRVRRGGHLRLTTQAATAVFAGDGPGARHRVDVTVDPTAVLEYFPGTVIPHTDSALRQRVDVDVAAGGVYLGWEAVAAGRIAHGERFGYACYDTALVLRVDGAVVARDRQVIAPATGYPAHLVDGDYLATFVAAAPGRDVEAVLRRVRAALDEVPGCHGGASPLPADTGVFVRLTAEAAPALHHARELLFTAARNQLVPKPERCAKNAG